MASSTSHHASSESRRLLVEWLGLLAGPLVWLTLLETNYVLAYVACETGRTWFLHLATLVAVLLVGGAGYASWSAYAAEPPSDAPHRQRSRWMSLGGMITSVWFIIVILAMEVPILVLRECQ